MNLIFANNCPEMTDGLSKLKYFGQLFAKTSFMTASGQL